MNVAGWTEEAMKLMDGVPRRRVNSNTASRRRIKWNWCQFASFPFLFKRKGTYAHRHGKAN
eukprot:scaffold2868_cov113-Skeletonema_menzelii.AAC.3